MIIEYWRRLKFFLARVLRLKGYGISILVPFNPDGEIREANWDWLKQYWENSLPGAEVVVGNDAEAETLAFSKSVAVNDAASRALGDIFVIVDADGYVPVESIIYCAEEIRLARKKNWKLWFMPYRRFFRLTEEASSRLLASDPKKPFQFSEPPSEDDYLNKGLYQGTPESEIGHWYGALIQVVSREAFVEVGGWDPRFRGWGGEDHAAMRATDTLYSPHKTIPAQVIHVWHPAIRSTNEDKDRMWKNQDTTGINNTLSGRYYWSMWNKKRMRSLVDEFRFLIPEILFDDPDSPECINSTY